MLDFMIATPKRHILARNRVFWHILRQNRSRGLGCSELQEPKKTKKNGKKHKVTHARKRNPWADRDELLHRCRGPRRDHLCQLMTVAYGVWAWLGGQSLGFPIDSRRRPYSRTAMRVCNHFCGPKKLVENNSSKPQLTRTKFGMHA